jgi:hypothetical protein
VKGIVYNLLEEIVSAEHGEDTWDALVAAASVDGVCASLGSYTDEDLQRLVAAVSQSPDEVVRWFGRRTMSLFAQHYGERLAIERPQCVKRGDDRCVLAVTALP